MSGRYFGFYWTRPVPWVGFENVSDDIEKVVKESRTILFSRALVQAYVRERRGVLVKEVARVELRHDRGTEAFGNEFAALLAEADREGARVVVVDFSVHYRVRRNSQMEKHFGEQPPHRYDKIDVYPGQSREGVDPFKVFEWWQKKQLAYTDGKPGMVQKIVAKLEEMDGSSSNLERAAVLNEAGLTTLNGRRWNKENVRGFARKYWPT